MAKKPTKTAKPPKVYKPWEELPKKPVGDRKAETLFMSVGRALTAWERLDNAQGLLFNELVQSRRGAAEAAYGVLQSPAGRTGMILEAAHRIFPVRDPMNKETLLTEIIQIANEIGQLAGRRNDIAHGIVTEFTKSETNAKGNVTQNTFGYFLIPGYANTRKQLSEYARMQIMIELGIDTPMHRYEKYAYTADQVDIYCQHFTDYRKRLMDLIFRIQDHCSRIFPHQEVVEQLYKQQIQDLQTKLTALESLLPPELSAE